MNGAIQVRFTFYLFVFWAFWFLSARLTIRTVYAEFQWTRLFCTVTGSMTWNSLTDSLRDPSLSIDSFRRQLKTFLFSNKPVCIQRIGDNFVDALYKSMFYLLAYLQLCMMHSHAGLPVRAVKRLLLLFILYIFFVWHRDITIRMSTPSWEVAEQRRYLYHKLDDIPT